MTGLPIVLGADRSPCEIFIQLEGQWLRVSEGDLLDAISDSPSLLRSLLRYVHAFSVQSAYTALANAQGALQERLAR